MTTMTKSDDLRQHLLIPTIQHAVESSPYYLRRIGAFASDVRSLADLPKLPLLYKKDLVEHVDELRTFKTYPDALFYTSGTTGKPLEVPVYREEIVAQEEILFPAATERFGDEMPLTLTVLRVGHGTHVVSPLAPSIPCHINYGLDQLLHFLRSTHWVNGRRVRVSNLELNVLNLRQVTNELLEAGIDPSSFGLETISISGWYVSRFERKSLERIWNATLLDRYGVTEVNGDSKWCETCEAYHFDFTVIPEFLHPDTGDAVEEGIATVVLTGLYPFNQAIPKLRYFLGDLVYVSNARCGLGEKSVRYLSRLTDAVRVPKHLPGGGNFRLFSADVAEALAPHSDVARKDKTGFLKFKLGATESGRPTIDIELNYIAALYPHRVTQLENEIRSSLSIMNRQVDDIQVNFHRPNGLAIITKI